MLSRPRDSLFVATAPGIHTLVTDLDEKTKYLRDFRLSFEKIPGGGTIFLADSHSENAMVP